MKSSPIAESKGADRRDFLKKIAAGTAAAAVGWRNLSESAGCAAPRPWTMRLSCSSINFASLPIEQACRRIADMGFEAIDIWSPHAKCPHLDDVADRLGAAGLKDLLKKSNLNLFSFSVYAGGYPKYAELLGQAGGGVAVRGSAGPCEPRDLIARMKAFLESLKPMAELADKHNSFLAIENHGHALLNSIDSFKAFVELNTNPRIGLALAPYHLQAIQASVEEAIAIAGKQLFFFYAWQNAPGKGQLPGIGPVDCAPWLSALARADYRGYVNPFMHHEPAPDEMSQAMTQSVDYLKKCCQKKLSSRG